MKLSGTIVLAATLTYLAGGRAAMAQTYAVDRGVWQLGGSVTLTHHSAGGAATTTGALSPRVGLFVAPGLVGFAQVPLSYTTAPNGHSVGFGIGPGLAYYFGRGPRTLYPYLSASLTAQASRDYVDGTSGPAFSVNGLTWQGSGGGVAMAAKNVGVSGELYYARTRSTISSAPSAVKATSTTTDYGVRFGIAVFVY